MNGGDIEVSEEAVASRDLLPEDVVRGPMQFTIGANDEGQVLTDDMLKLESCNVFPIPDKADEDPQQYLMLCSIVFVNWQ